MSEKEIGLGRLFVQEAIKASTWGMIFMLIMGMLILSLKQDIKEGIAYGIDRIAGHVTLFVTDPYLIGKTKQLAKEGIEYSLEKASKEAGDLLSEKTVAFTIRGVDVVLEPRRGNAQKRDQ